jgi:hypothetical protein
MFGYYIGRSVNKQKNGMDEAQKASFLFQGTRLRKDYDVAIKRMDLYKSYSILLAIKVTI